MIDFKYIRVKETTLNTEIIGKFFPQSILAMKIKVHNKTRYEIVFDFCFVFVGLGSTEALNYQ